MSRNSGQGSHNDVLEALAISPPDIYQLYVLFIAFTVYHQVRHDYRNNSISLRSPPTALLTDASTIHRRVVAAASKLELVLGNSPI